MSDIYGAATGPTGVPTNSDGSYNPEAYGAGGGMPMPGAMPTAGSDLTYQEIRALIQELALTGSLSQLFLGQPGAFQTFLAEYGIGPNEMRRLQQTMQVRVGFGVRIDAGQPEYGDGLTTASVRAREGSLPEDLAKGKVTPKQISGGNSYGAEDIWTAPWRKFTQTEFEQMQRMLYDAGMYTSDVAPAWGDRSDPGFRNAWFLAVQENYAAGNTSSLDEFLSQKAIAGGPVEEQLQIPEQIINLTDAASIRTASDDIAQGELGRKLTDEQKASMVDLIHQLETQAAQAGIGVDTSNFLTDAGINIGGVAGNITSDIALATGQALASQYGLTVGSHIRSPAHNAAIGGARNSDHLTGLAVDISGSWEQMEALGAWAATQEGPGKLFRWVGWKDDANHFDHVHLSFNSVVTDPAATSSLSLSPAGSVDGGVEDFMAATRTVESGGDYGVTNSIGAYGAYQFMPGTWASAAAMAGIDPNDRSPGAQDAAARALMTRYYQMYGDWRLVAVAWHGGEGMANKYKNNIQGLHGVGDGNISTYDYMTKVMENMANPGVGGPIGPATTSIQGIDYQARLEEELRKKFPTEAKSHDLALTFQTFADTAFGGMNSGGFEL